MVDEIEAKRPSVGVLIIRRGTDGRAKNKLLQFCSVFAQTLIPPASIYQDSSPEVWECLAQWLLQAKRKGHQYPSWWAVFRMPLLQGLFDSKTHYKTLWSYQIPFRKVRAHQNRFRIEWEIVVWKFVFVRFNSYRQNFNSYRRTFSKKPIVQHFVLFVCLDQFWLKQHKSDVTILSTSRPTIKVKKYANQMKTDEMASILRLAMLSSEDEVERFLDTMYLVEFWSDSGFFYRIL